MVLSDARSIHRIRSAEEPEFDALAAIYQTSLPRSEQKTVEALAAMALLPGYLFLAAKEKDTVCGFSITLLFADADACLLEYMAVAPEQRGRGVGAWLFMQTMQRPEVAGRFVLAEVDSDKAAAQAGCDARRRKEFYRRLGCRELDGLAYLMPPVLAAEQPPAMEMLAWRQSLPASVEKARLRQWLECCYTQVYHQAADDPRMAAMLQGLPNEIQLV